MQKMKIKHEWLMKTTIAGLASIASSTTPSFALAQEEKSAPAAETTEKKSGEFDVDAMVKKVMEAMDKTNVSADIKKQVAEQLREVTKNKEFYKKEVEAAMEVAKDAAKQASEAAKNLKKDLRARVPQWNTRIVSPLGNDDEDYRIGVALSAVSEDTSSDSDGTAKHEKLAFVTVESIMEDSPAAKVGIKAGDRLLTANGKALSEVSDLKTEIQAAGKDSKPLKIELERDGKKIQLELKPSKMKIADQVAERIELSMPSEGFVLDSDAMNRWMHNRARGLPGAGMAMVMPGSEVGDLKKEIGELKDEIAELKELIQQLVNKK
jgi:C-terminal processing protease CtpA/Prc